MEDILMSTKDIEMMKRLGIIKEDTKENKIEQIKNDKAYISNELIQSIFHTTNTLTAIKILFYLARIDTTNNIKKGNYHHIKVVIKDLENYSGLGKKTLDRNIKTIQETTVTFYSEKDKQLFSRTPLITRVEYINSREMIVDIHEDILQRINETKEYTEIDTLNIMKIKHKHSAKMIMLLTMISKFSGESKKQKRYDLEQLNYLFDVNYKTYGEIDRKILAPVKEELDNNSSISFSYDKIEDMLYTGKGRKPIKEIVIKPELKKHIETSFEDMMVAQDEYNKKQQPTTKDQNNLSPKVPTEADIKYAIDEMQVTPNEAEQKYKMFLDWEKSIGKKRSFQKYLLDGKEKGL